MDTECRGARDICYEDRILTFSSFYAIVLQLFVVQTGFIVIERFQNLIVVFDNVRIWGIRGGEFDRSV